MRRALATAGILFALFLSALPDTRAQAPGAEPQAPAAADEVATARALARDGKRQEAIRMLESRLERVPDDSEGRVLLGTVLSWEGSYDEARGHLERVLAVTPLHYDAIRALINVELWSDHPARAELLANEALAATPDAADLLEARARARSTLAAEERARNPVAGVEGNVVVQSAPASPAAPERLWRVGGVAYYDWFSDGRSAWREAQVNLKRKTKWGSWIAKYWKVDHFDTRDDQLELEVWPRIREGTYASLDATVSIDSDLVYADFSLGGEIYQSLGHGWEGSFGYRYLDFDGSGTNIWTTTLGRYFGNWFVFGRVYYVPSVPSDSWSFYLQARRYFGDGTEYFAMRAGRGTYREEIRTTGDLTHLASYSLSVEVWKVLSDRLELTAGAGYSQSGRGGLTDLGQYSLSAGIYYRF